MRLGLVCLTISALLIVGVWAFLGRPHVMPRSPVAEGGKLYCLSYAPFQGRQTPLDPSTMIPAAQIESDIASLARITNCVRVYSTDFGLDQIAGIAARHGLKVLQGLWLSSNPAKNKIQVDDAVRLAETYPGTIIAVIVGNEVLLRGDMAAADLAATIRAVKARVKVPVTYADVWEFWLRNPDVAAAADFITIHILPYWEDFPIPARNAAAHVDAIRRQVVKAFAPKEVIIGEVGWPSQGRMREGALPSPSNQARVIQEVLALAARDNVRVNVIEAYDAPWKRALEGVVGGYWGLFDDATRAMKFKWGEPVSDHPYWKAQSAGGVIFAVIVFGAAFAARRGTPVPLTLWLAVSACAIAGGVTAGWTLVNVPVESIGAGGWARLMALAAVALLTPPVMSAAIMRGTPMPSMTRIIGPADHRSRDPLTLLMGAIVIASLLLTFIIALALVFDARYRDFPFAPLTAVAVPLLVHGLVVKHASGARGAAEVAGAAVMLMSVPYIVFNETFANWQSLWLCAMLVVFAISLLRVRDARS